ncbi:MAG: formimidoylglutamate deiminase [Deltaproteobacteria bacterium]|jgi:formimidoylglutamate deiminase
MRTPFVREQRIVVPGIASAHSHAFQRALRGRAQASRARRDAGATGASFWSWRGLMYALAERVTPEELYALSHYAFVELASAGVTCVGEFHYLQHDRGGRPYGERTLLADTVIRAALDAGLRITLLRVAYLRAGLGRALEPAQHRFVDGSIDETLRDLESLAARWAHEPRVRIGLAPHSVRAVPREALFACAQFARERSMPLHAHVSEQRREVRECIAEHGRRPVELLSEVGVISERFSAVHATHLDTHEARLLGEARAYVCVCRTTERDLGDGLPNLAALAAHGARFTTGTDSHASADPFEEARAMELDERTRAEAREVAFDAQGLVAALGRDAYASLGFDLDTLDDGLELDARDPAIDALVERDSSEAVHNALAWQATSRAVRSVRVAGREIVKGGRHVALDAARGGYETAIRALLARARV